MGDDLSLSYQPTRNHSGCFRQYPYFADNKSLSYRDSQIGMFSQSTIFNNLFNKERRRLTSGYGTIVHFLKGDFLKRLTAWWKISGVYQKDLNSFKFKLKFENEDPTIWLSQSN